MEPSDTPDQRQRGSCFSLMIIAVVLGFLWLLLVVSDWVVAGPIILVWAIHYVLWGRAMLQQKAGQLRYALVCCGLAMVILAVGGGYYWYECQRRITTAQVQSLLDADGPRAGSSVEEVLDWLGSHGIYNTEISLTERRWSIPTAEQAGGPEVNDAKKVLMGCYWDAYVDPLLKGDIYIFFYFDAKNQLFKTVVKGCPRSS